MDDDTTPAPSPIGELRRQYEEERFYRDDRAAAECAYALAVRLREAGEWDEARRYAGECLVLAESLPSSTLDDVASARLSVGGVPMPERFHDDVVRVRLADLLDATKARAADRGGL
jgi:hypothetical protein